MQDFAIPIEIWVDGSFSTTKPDPEDIDLCMFAKNADIMTMDPDDIELFKTTIDSHQELKVRYHCDVTFSNSELDDLRMSCMGLFGFSRSEEPKGIPRIWITP